MCCVNVVAQVFRWLTSSLWRLPLVFAAACSFEFLRLEVFLYGVLVAFVWTTFLPLAIL